MCCALLAWQSSSSSLGAHRDIGQDSEGLPAGVRRRSRLKPELLSVCSADDCWHPGFYHLPEQYTQFITLRTVSVTNGLVFINKHHLLIVCTGSSHSEDGLRRRLCALLSLPWLCENKSSSECRTASFPSWVPALAQRLACSYCECLRHVACIKILIFFIGRFRCECNRHRMVCLLQPLTSGRPACHCWLFCVTACVINGERVCFPPLWRVRMRRSG